MSLATAKKAMDENMNHYLAQSKLTGKPVDVEYNVCVALFNIAAELENVQAEQQRQRAMLSAIQSRV